jgi:excisionase family DNA binding protein
MKPLAPALDRRLDDVKELAQFLNVSPASVWKLKKKPDFPFVQIGASIRFDRAAVLAWMQRS